MAKKTSQSDALSTVINNFNASWQYTQSSWHDRWQNSQYLYNGNRVKRAYHGITDTFVPMCFSTVETLTSGLFGSKPKFAFMPPQEKKDQPTDILNSLLDYYWEKDQWSLRIINTGRNTFKLGTAVDYFFWDVDHPRMINVPIRDFFIAPTASELSECATPYCGRRFLTTLEELKSFEIVDFDKEPDFDGNYPMKPKYTNLDKVQMGASHGDNTDKQEKDMWYGSTVSGADSKQIEVIEYWTVDRTISVANRSTVIEDCENYYKAKSRANGDRYPKGILPFADSRDYVDESLFYAKGEIDIIGDQNELLNDMTNQNIDAITYTLNPMFRLDPKRADIMSEIESLPGAGIAVERGEFEWLPFQAIPSNAYLERQNIKNEIREATASSETVRGTESQGGQQTATEINAQIAGAGQRFSLKVTQIENGYFYRMAKIVFRMIQLYVTEPMMVRILGKDGARWEEFDPSEFSGDYEPRVQLEASINNERQRDANNAKELLGAFLGDPEINQLELKKLVLTKSFNLDPDEVEVLIAQPDPMSQNMGMEQMGGMPPEMGGMPPMGLPEPPPDPRQMMMEQKMSQADEKHQVDLAMKVQKLQEMRARAGM
jgi:hypothetical protein